MSVTNQKVSNLLLDGVLFNAATTPQGAKVLVRRIIPIAISSILYRRTDVDRDNFIMRERNGVPYIMFNDKLKDRSVMEVRKWVTGVLEAFDKNYLKEVYLLFCSITDETEVKETYKFQIKYFEAGENSQELAAAKQETLDTTDFLLKAINDLESFTKFKQAEVRPFIALTYYPNVTPGYHPRYFEGSNDRAISIMNNIPQGKEAILYLGAVKTKSYRIKCSGNGKLLVIPDKTNSDYTTSITDKSMDIDDCFKDNEQDNEKDTTPSNECILLSDEDSTNENKIQCICSVNTKFKNIEMVECSDCYNLRHAPCLGYLYSTTIPKRTVCDVCNASTSLFSQDSITRQTNSLYCLVVAYTFFNNTFPDKILEQSIYKDFVIKKLLELKCVTANESGYTVNVKMVEKIVEDLFPTENTTALPDSCSLLTGGDDGFFLNNTIKKLRLK